MDDDLRSAGLTAGSLNQHDLIWAILKRTDPRFGKQLERIEKQQGEILMALQNVHDQLVANNAVIAELTGDVTELKSLTDSLTTTNEELAMKIEELKAQLPDSELVTSIETLVGQQSVDLRKAADIHPEPAPEPEPTPEA